MTDVSVMDESDEMQEEYGAKIKNPSYIAGTKRIVYEFLNAIKYSDDDLDLAAG